MIYIKTHMTPEGEILAACDSELLGKIYSENGKELDLKTYDGFYRGEMIHEEEIRVFLTDGGFYTANLVGERSVSEAISAGIAQKSQIHRIADIPYVQIFRIL